MPEKRLTMLYDFLYSIEFEYKDCYYERGLEVKVKDGDVEITLWERTKLPYDLDRYEQWRRTPVLKAWTTVPLIDILDPEYKHLEGELLDLLRSDPLKLAELSEESLKTYIVHAAWLWIRRRERYETWVENVCD